VPAELAELITHKLHIPTIGIGAGVACDGQVQVFHDILGLFDEFVPRHTKQFAQLGTAMREAVGAYVHDVQAGTFPAAENSFTMKAEIIAALRTDGEDNGG
jgi:3-methyl-2-oxobutanoate hydroxymethyltransferase